LFPLRKPALVVGFGEREDVGAEIKTSPEDLAAGCDLPPPRDH
jgi:hypothetical protein